MNAYLEMASKSSNFLTISSWNINGLEFKAHGVKSNKFVCLFVLWFYGPVNPLGSCRARSVYLTTRLLGRLSPLSG